MDGDGRLSLVEMVQGIWTTEGGRFGEADLGGRCTGRREGGAGRPEVAASAIWADWALGTDDRRWPCQEGRRWPRRRSGRRRTKRMALGSPAADGEGRDVTTSAIRASVDEANDAGARNGSGRRQIGATTRPAADGEGRDGGQRKGRDGSRGRGRDGG